MPFLTTVDISFSLTAPTILVRIALWIVLAYRRVRYGYTFRRIKLTRGKFALVDPDDFERLNQHKWYCTKSGYAKRAVKNKSGKGPKQVTICMHNLICPVPEGMLVDHKNRNRLDNRKANLRPATEKQNIWNRKIPRKMGITRFTVIYWDKKVKKWRVTLKVGKQHRGFGVYTDEIEAAKVYDKVAKEYRGEFAVLNFPEK
ncbi:HNH endonuclease [Planctomycetota bacterium]